jgi:2-polyprenyl-3-methyl-5-hydroxy-6-metoxy-1,4-benzoquinol methylase
MNRKQRRAGRTQGGGSPVTRLPAGPPSAAMQTELFNQAVMHHHAGAFGAAERCYRQLLAGSPRHAEAHGRLGAVLMRQGKLTEAIFHIEHALSLRPEMFEACGNLAQAFLWSGQGERAIDAACRALELKETPQSQAMFTQCIAFARFSQDNGRFRGLVLRALVGRWIRPRELAAVSISLIKLNSAVTNAIALSDAAWPRRLPPGELFGAEGILALAQDELLCRLIECDPVTDVGLERLLTNVRCAMLEIATAGSPCNERLLGFYCSVARQCFINEYVFSATEAEIALAQGLHASLERTLAAGDTPPAHLLAAVGAYFPLHLEARPEEVVRARSWPQPVDAVIAQQVNEVARESRTTPDIPVLTSIDDGISSMVRQQYEENPYPRWTQLGSEAQQAVSFGQQPEKAIDALIAGCGTGLFTVQFARQTPSARILAIDLSLASLRYAKRMAEKLGVTNVEFGQADILKLGSLGRQFDFIDSSGVLHHLADPWSGWRILLSLLRPGGTMQVGLYSELARRNVVAARALIAERGYRPNAKDIRRCREDIMAAKDECLRSVATRDDFFTMSECRDLLFHVQEQRITLPEIKSFIAANGIQFGGFFLDSLTHHRFAARFPRASASVDLDCWHAFETEAPDTFAGMYQFSVRKPDVPRP